MEKKSGRVSIKQLRRSGNDRYARTREREKKRLSVGGGSERQEGRVEDVRQDGDKARAGKLNLYDDNCANSPGEGRRCRSTGLRVRSIAS